VRKAISEQQKGKTSVLVLPVFDYVTRLLVPFVIDLMVGL